MPVRIQRRIANSWVPPLTAKYVGRPTHFGNPFTHLESETLADFVVATRQASVDYYEAMVTGDPHDILGAALDTPGQIHAIMARGSWIRSNLSELTGKDLICWCPLEDRSGNRFACHADILLRLSNPGWIP